MNHWIYYEDANGEITKLYWVEGNATIEHRTTSKGKHEVVRKDGQEEHRLLEGSDHPGCCAFLSMLAKTVEAKPAFKKGGGWNTK